MAPMQGKTNFGDFKYFAGIDVRKAHLDLRVAGRTSGARFDNDALGVARLLASLANAHLDGPHLVVIEPTGRSHLALWRALDVAGHGARHRSILMRPAGWPRVWVGWQWSGGQIRDGSSMSPPSVVGP